MVSLAVIFRFDGVGESRENEIVKKSNFGNFTAWGFGDSAAKCVIICNFTDMEMILAANCCQICNDNLRF